jgi:hypothetical protein
MISMKMTENDIRRLLPQVDHALPDLLRECHLPGMRETFMPHVAQGEARIYQDMPTSGGDMAPQAPDA